MPTNSCLTTLATAFILLAGTLLPRGLGQGDLRLASGRKFAALNHRHLEVSLTAASVEEAVNALQRNSACRGLFGTGTDPAIALLNSYQAARPAGIEFGLFQEIDQDAQATTELTLAGVPVIRINTRADIGFWPAGNAEENARTLIHELGHVFNFAPNLGGSAFEDDVDDEGELIQSSEKRNLAREEICIPTSD